MYGVISVYTTVDKVGTPKMNLLDLNKLHNIDDNQIQNVNDRNAVTYTEFLIREFERRSVLRAKIAIDEIVAIPRPRVEVVHPANSQKERDYKKPKEKKKALSMIQKKNKPTMIQKKKTSNNSDEEEAEERDIYGNDSGEDSEERTSSEEESSSDSSDESEDGEISESSNEYDKNSSNSCSRKSNIDNISGSSTSSSNNSDIPMPPPNRRKPIFGSEALLPLNHPIVIKQRHNKDLLYSEELFESGDKRVRKQASTFGGVILYGSSKLV